MIRNKDKLIQIIGEKINTKDELDLIWFFNDGSWRITKQNEFIPNTICRSIKELIQNNTNNISIAIDYNLEIVENELKQRRGEV